MLAYEQVYVTVGTSAPTKEKASAMFKAEAFIKKVFNNMCLRERESARARERERVCTHTYTCIYIYIFIFIYIYIYIYKFLRL
jgi:hypothetical protein